MTQLTREQAQVVRDNSIGLYNIGNGLWHDPAATENAKTAGKELVDFLDSFNRSSPPTQEALIEAFSNALAAAPSSQRFDAQRKIQAVTRQLKGAGLDVEQHLISALD